MFWKGKGGKTGAETGKEGTIMAVVVLLREHPVVGVGNVNKE